MKRGAGTLEPWSTKEKLCLSSAVLRSGDQNWMSVSRQLRVFGEQDRPPEWYSQKQCALQYESLLNNVGTSKRKKRSEKGVETVDTPSESIVRRLLQERLEELRFLLEQDRKDYMRIKKEMEDIDSGRADDRLDEFEREIEEEMEREAGRASILRQHEERSRLEGGRITPHPPPSSENTVEQPETKVPTSPLLTSLLQSPTTYRGSMHNLLTPPPPLSRVNDSPTLSRLLESPAKQLEPTRLFTSPVKKEPIEEDTSQNIPANQSADALPIIADVIPEIIEEVQTGSPLLIEIKKETLEEKEIDTMNVQEIPEEIIEEVADVQMQEEVEVMIHTEEELKTVPTTTAEVEEPEGEKEDQEHSSLTNLQDSDTMEEQPITELDRQMVNMIVAGGGVISVSHDTSSEHLEEVTSSDIQHKEDSEAAESVKEDSLDDVGDEIVKESEVASCAAESTEADSCQSVEEDALNSFIIGPETPKDNYVVQLLCSTPENILEEESKMSKTKEPQKTEIQKEGTNDATEVEEELSGAVLEVGGEMVSLGGAVVVEEEADTTVHEVEVLVSELDSAPSSGKTVEEEDTASTPDVDMKDVESPDTEPNDESQDNTDVVTHQTSIKEESVGDEKEEETNKDKSLVFSKVIEGKAESPSAVEEDSEGGKKPAKRRLISGSDSKPSSPACHMIEDSKEYLSWKKSIMLVFNCMATHKYASIFLRPITNEQAPAYDTVIHRPVDLSTIKKRIESGELRTTVEFQRDLLLMFQNAIMYNNSRSLVYEMATVMQTECMQHIELMVEAMGEGVPWRKYPVSVDKLNTRGRGEAPKRKRATTLEDKTASTTKIKKEPVG